MIAMIHAMQTVLMLMSSWASLDAQTMDWNGADPVAQAREFLGGRSAAGPAFPRPHAAMPAASESEALYAVPILQTDVNENVFIVALDDAGNRAIVEHYVPGALFIPNHTEIRLMTRSAAGWSGSLLLSRNDSDGSRSWIAGVTLSALAFSGDGKHLVFRRLEDIRDYDSVMVKALDVDSGEETALAGPLGGNSAQRRDEAEIRRIVAGSDWFRKTYPGRSWEEVFPDTFRRCSGPESVKAGIQGRHSLVVTKEGAVAHVFPLKTLPGTRAWAFQDGWFGHAMSKDCSRGLIAVQEVLGDSRPSLFHGSQAFDARVRLMEFGSIGVSRVPRETPAPASDRASESSR